MNISNEDQIRQELIERSEKRKSLENMDLSLELVTDSMPKHIPKDVQGMLKKGSGKTIEQLRKEQLNPEQVYYQDAQGKNYINREFLEKELLEDKKQKAIQEHQNDMKRRLYNGGFPTSQSTLDFCLAEPVLFSGGNPKYKLAKPQNQMREAFSRGKSIFAFGEVGSGKTTVACRLSTNWMKEDPTRQAYFISMATWFEDIFASDAMDKVFEIKKRELSKAKLVCIDDFDKFPMGEWANKKVFGLIDMFHSRGTQVIITSNRSLLELSNHPKSNIDFEAVANRITGSCGDLGIIEFNHKSFR